MPRERELGRWCKTSPQMLFDPKNRAARSFSSFLVEAVSVDAGGHDHTAGASRPRVFHTTCVLSRRLTG